MRLVPATSQPLEVLFSMTPALAAGATKALTFKLYYLNSGLAAVLITTFKTAMDAVLQAAWSAALSDEYIAPTIEIRDMRVYDTMPVEFLPAVNGGYLGTGGLESLPPSASVSFEKQTGLRGKENRGRINLPMVAEDNTEDSVLTAGAIILYNALGTALKTNVVAGGQTFVPQLYSQSLSNQTLGVAGIWMANITGMKLFRTITNLKRRKPKNIVA